MEQETYNLTRREQEIQDYVRIIENFLIVVTIVVIGTLLTIIFANEIELARLESTINYSHIYAERVPVKQSAWKYIMSMEVDEDLLVDTFTQVNENIGTTIDTTTETINYVPSEEERIFAYRLAFGEAGIEDSLGQTLVINVAINNMKEQNYSSLIEEFNAKGRYSSVSNGEVYICGEIVSIEDVPQNVKEAVDAAFEYDYSQEMLKKEAERLGITDSQYWEGGALYFYNPVACSEYQNKLRENVKVKFQYGRHIFYRYWDE